MLLNIPYAEDSVHHKRLSSPKYPEAEAEKLELEGVLYMRGEVVAPPCSQSSQGSHLSQSEIQSSGGDKACRFRSRSPRSPFSSLPPYSPALPPAVPHTPGALPLGLECSLPLAAMLLSISGMFTLTVFKFLLTCHLRCEAFGATSPALAQRPLSSFLAVCFPTAAITVQHYFIYCIVVFPVRL